MAILSLKVGDKRKLLIFLIKTYIKGVGKLQDKLKKLVFG